VEDFFELWALETNAMTSIKLSADQRNNLLEILQKRFEKNKTRSKDILWKDVEARLIDQEAKLWSLHQMEETGGEPDVLDFDPKTGEYIFFDCSAETPAGRRSFCYDREALDARKENKPANNAIDAAAEMGIEILDEEQYRFLQQFGPFDQKTSSWLKTPNTIRKLGGAIFGDYRYGQVFIYHNGVQSYYAARAFRGLVKI
jgi:hypothetical protein